MDFVAVSNLWVKNQTDPAVMVTDDDLEDDTIDGKSTLEGEPIKKLKQSFKDKHNID